jgi:endo-1,4-beta-xylanase
LFNQRDSVIKSLNSFGTTMKHHLQTSNTFSRRDAMALLAAGVVAPQNSAQSNTDASADVPALAAAFAKHFPVGIAVTPGQVTVFAQEFIKKHFNILVAENVMKPGLLAKRSEGNYDFSQADDIVNFGMQNGMKVRGHTLCWHQQMPTWFFTESGKDVSREVLLARMDRYITDVMTHFKGRVYAWDVVNEAYVFGEPNEAVDSNGMRMNAYRRIIGPEYIEYAFKFAAKADPKALLFYNDYETQNNAKLNAIVELVKNFKRQGIKIDGVGHQAHCTVTHPSIEAFEYAIDEIAKLGVTQEITELDIALNSNIMDSKVTESTPELLEKQALRYAAFFDLFVRKKNAVSAVLMWGLNDSASWMRYWPRRRYEAPLMFDDQSRPKPAFWKVMDVAKKHAKTVN